MSRSSAITIVSRSRPVSGDRVWFLNTADGHQGPFSPNDLVGMLRDGHISQDWYVWREGMANWQSLSEAPGLLPIQQTPIYHQTALSNAAHSVNQPNATHSAVSKKSESNHGAHTSKVSSAARNIRPIPQPLPSQWPSFSFSRYIVPERPLSVTILCLFIGLFAVGNFMMWLTGDGMIYLFEAVLTVGIIDGLWRMKRWGMIAYFAVLGIGLLGSFVDGNPPRVTSLLSKGCIVVYLCRLWKDME